MQNSRTMQDSPYFYYPYYENTLDEHSAKSPYSATFAGSPPYVAPTFTQMIVPTPIPLSREVQLITTGDDSSLSTVPRAAEDLGYLPIPPNVLNQALDVAPSRSHLPYANIHSLQDQIYDILRERLLELPPEYRQSFMDNVSASVREDINLSVRPRWTDGEASTAPAFTPPSNETLEENVSGSFIQFGANQVPSGTANRELSRRSWLQCGEGDSRHAVEWQGLSQPTSLRTADALPQAVTPSLDQAASFQAQNGLISQAQLGRSTTGFGDHLPRMVHPITGQVPSFPSRRRNQRRSRGFDPRPERAHCDECQKLMLQQSLKRHKQEVHAKVKRARTKSTFILVTP